MGSACDWCISGDPANSSAAMARVSETDTLKLSIKPFLKSFPRRKAAGLSHISPSSAQLICTFVFYLQKPGIVKGAEMKSKKP